jgi:hypothetical protein
VSLDCAAASTWFTSVSRAVVGRGARTSRAFDYIGCGNTGKKLSSIVKCYNPGGATSKERYDWISTHLANAVEEAVGIRNTN